MQTFNEIGLTEYVSVGCSSINMENCRGENARKDWKMNMHVVYICLSSSIAGFSFIISIPVKL